MGDYRGIRNLWRVEDARPLDWVVGDYEGKMPSLLLVLAPAGFVGVGRGILGEIAFLWWGILGDGGGSWVEIV